MESSSVVPSPSPHAATIEQLQHNLTSLIRVRNRLAETRDSKLPDVLTGLLPRLLMRLEDNTLLLYAPNYRSSSDDSLAIVREQTQLQLTGMIAHVVERIRGSRDMPVPWMQPVLLASHAMETSVALTLTLTILETGLPRVDNQQILTAMTAPLIALVDKFHGNMNEQALTKSGQLHSRTAGWLFWNTVALQSGLRALVDWDTDAWDAPCAWNDLEQAPSASLDAVKAGERDGSGVMELLLDILLFWPPTTDRSMQNEAVDNSTGLPIEGLLRINHARKGSSWNDVYLRQLKYSCLRYAVWPLDQGLFRGLTIGLDRARLLCILTSSGGSMHGRLAASFLNQCDGTSRLCKVVKDWTGSETSCSLALACSLLVLILGDSAAKLVLDAYTEQRPLWEELFGERPVKSALQRAPLPYAVAARAAEYVRDSFRPPASLIATGGNDIRLFVDLVAAIQDPRHHGVYWGIQLIEGMYFQLRKTGIQYGDEWTKMFYDRCLVTSGSVLAAALEPSEVQGSPRREQRQDLPGGVAAPFGRRKDLNHLLSTHRIKQKKKQLRLESAVRARKTAYQMITELSRNAGEDDSFKLSFKLPVVLFKCACSEEDAMQPCVASALEAILRVYIRLAHSRSNDTAQYVAAPLLPSLLFAACSDSAVARIATVRWCSELLSIIDPPAGVHICKYLSEDTDGLVASLAKKAVPKLKMIAGEKTKPENPALLLDTSNSNDRATIRRHLIDTVSSFSAEAGITPSAACIALNAYTFSSEAALAAFRLDRLSALRNSGLLCRSNLDESGMEFKNQEAILDCEICYDSVSRQETHALPCGHTFCRTCWKSYLTSAFEAGPLVISKVACPHHACGERLVKEDVSSIDGELSERWENALITSFITKEERFRACPGADCQVVAYLLELSSQTIICDRCTTSYCFQCGDRPHEPAKCGDFSSWNQIFSSSSFWLKKNSKPCPSCHVPIEKNTGCNHIKCTRCDFDFCWLCLAPLQTHMEPHACNRYDPSSNVEDDEDHRALFYTERHQAHDEAEEFSKDQIKNTEDLSDEVSKKLWFLSQEYFDAHISALRTLIEARHFLKHSYIAAWAIRDQTEKRDVFGGQQAALEMVTERLSQMTTAKLDEVFKAEGERGLRLHFRSITFHVSSVESYVNRIVSFDREFQLTENRR